MQSEMGLPPRYAQLAARIRIQIFSGALQPGSRVPSEPELTADYGVSKTTASRALGMLAEEGLIVRKSGSGSFVTEDVPALIEVTIAPGDRVTFRPSQPGVGDVPALASLVVETPGRPARVYPADRTVITCDC